jgi:thioredoxin reductase
MEANYDVVVIGGGAAGLSGALALSRARRKVLVVDAGLPRNAPATGVHNYLGQEGTSPLELLAIGREEVARYGGRVETGTVVAAKPDGDGFRLELADGRAVGTRRVLVTTGLVDELPDVPGLAERWGRDILHCPYCDGWEFRDRALGVLSTGPFGVQQAQMFRQWSPDVTLFLHTGPEPDDHQWEELAARGIAVVVGEIAGIEVADDRLTGVRLASGEVVAREALVVLPRFAVSADAVSDLGLATVPQEHNGLVMGEHVPADPMGATSVPGVWVAGNVVDARLGVIGAAAAGLNAAIALNADLIAEDVRHAVTARRSTHGMPSLRNAGR